MNLNEAALATDLYELTMAAAYFENQVKDVATFELFVREYPKNRSYLVAAGLQQAVEYLTNLRFDDAEVDFLRKHPAFEHVSDGFFQYLKSFRFTGDLWAMPEGTVFFPKEPVLRITAPMIEAQIVETFLLSTINFQTLIASKATRIVEAARDRAVVEFGARRAHGPEAALLAARAAYIGGCIGTSNVLAGYKFGIPTYGTVAHSFIMYYDTEREAFDRFNKVFPSNPTFLLDTYDTVEAANTVASMHLKPALVRLDSGDRAALSRKVRAILDKAGMTMTKIFVSGDLNEYKVSKLLKKNAPIDSFGVGTDLSTSRDAPALPGIYKLVALNHEGRTIFKVKTSAGKKTRPGAKQVYRRAGDRFEDVIALETENPPANTVPLLVEIMKGGRLTASLPSLRESREKARLELTALPLRFHRFQGSAKPPVHFSRKLEQTAKRLWAASV